MIGPDDSPPPRPTLLADANVLIDYAKSAPEILALVAQYVGPLRITSGVLREVAELDRKDCDDLGIRVVEPTSDQLLRAAGIESRVSFDDGLCLVICRDEGWICATNDRALQRLCEKHGVSTRFGLRLLVDLVEAKAISRCRAETVARQIQEGNPAHINERVMRSFRRALDQAEGS